MGFTFPDAKDDLPDIFVLGHEDMRRAGTLGCERELLVGDEDLKVSRSDARYKLLHLPRQGALVLQGPPAQGRPD